MNNSGIYKWIDGQVVKISDDTPSISTDAYFPSTEGSRFEEHLANEQNPHGQWVSGKKHKQRIMKELGVRESGDKVHGARSQY